MFQQGSEWFMKGSRFSLILIYIFPSPWLSCTPLLVQCSPFGPKLKGRNLTVRSSCCEASQKSNKNKNTEGEHRVPTCCVLGSLCRLRIDPQLLYGRTAKAAFRCTTMNSCLINRFNWVFHRASTARLSGWFHHVLFLPLILIQCFVSDSMFRDASC